MNSIEGLGINTNLFLIVPTWSDPLIIGYNDNRELYEYPGTRTQLYSLGSLINHNIKYSYTNISKEDEFTITNFYVDTQGKLKRFWIPYYKNNFIPVNNIIGGLIEIENAGFYEIDRGSERIFIKLKDGTIFTRKVTAIIDNGVTEIIILNTPILTPINIADIQYLGRLFLVRFNEDSCELDFKSSAASSCVLSFQEVYHESLEVTS